MINHLDTKHLIISMAVPCGTCHRVLPVSLYSNYFSYEVSQHDKAGIAMVGESLHHTPGAAVCAVCGEGALIDDLQLTPTAEIGEELHSEYLRWYESPSPFALIHPPCIGILAP